MTPTSFAPPASLADSFPNTRELPRMKLADLPTPLEPARPWEAWLRHPGVWVKRDDLASRVYGGNKVRRFEYLFADARQKQRTRLVTVGGIASTQVTATALLGAAHGFAVTAVLFDQPITDFAKRSLALNTHAGAELIYGGNYVSTVWRTVRAAMRKEAYFIEPGAGTPLANLGYVDAVYELAEQVRAGLAPIPDYIVVPSGSCGTVAALALGCSLLGWHTEVIGVRITLAIACNRLLVWQRIKALQRLLQLDGDDYAAPRFSLFGAVLGKGYGYPSEAAVTGAKEWAALTGVTGEITYTGKAMAALRMLTHAQPGKTFLFWNTLSSVPLPDVGDAPKLRELCDAQPAFARVLAAPSVSL